MKNENSKGDSDGPKKENAFLHSEMELRYAALFSTIS
jgi:hypothetical protein